jgi:hypothetical protein
MKLTKAKVRIILRQECKGVTTKEIARDMKVTQRRVQERHMKIAVIGGGVAGAELIRAAWPGPLEFTLIEPKRQIELQAL